MNGTEAEPPQKSAKQLEKEAKKQAKLDKFKQKQQQKCTKSTADSAEVSFASMYTYLFSLAGSLN